MSSDSPFTIEPTAAQLEKVKAAMWMARTEAGPFDTDRMARMIWDAVVPMIAASAWREIINWRNGNEF